MAELVAPDCPCLTGEIAEPRPDMNIKVAAFTESKKFYYTFHFLKQLSILKKLVSNIKRN